MSSRWTDWGWLPRLHYVLNLGLISSYALARRYFTQHGHTRHSRILTTPEHLFALEKQAGGMMAAVLAVQVSNTPCFACCPGSTLQTRMSQLYSINLALQPIRSYVQHPRESTACNAACL